MKNKYRIVDDEFCGYEAQIQYWFLPFKWFQIGEKNLFSNTWQTLEEAKEFIEKQKNGPIVYWESN